jgi:uncharacterized membrane protein
MFAGQLALVLAAAFAGAAFYVGYAEHPARLRLDDSSSVRQWKPSYEAGTRMQGSLAVISGLLGLLAAWNSHDWRWVLGAVLMFANWPYTLIAIMPTNRQLAAAAAADTRYPVRVLLERWGRLHALRTVLGVAATAVYLLALS